jgi:uncharacterized protein YaiL (DUF2058 family)
MSMSLRDQLLQAGLINEKQAREAEKQAQQLNRKGPPPRKPQPQSPPPRRDPAQEARRRAEDKARMEAAAKLLERERIEREKAERKARRLQIQQLIAAHRIAKPDSDDRYNFIVGEKIRRISVDAAMRAGLGDGSLRIVRCDGLYDVVPAAIAERIGALDERAVVAAGPDTGAPPDEDDPYKDYIVPDDLIW